ncbi:hypothetical protein ACS0TY_011823 [Phlomoides rotata]
METIAPAAILNVNNINTQFKTLTPNPNKIQIQLPLHRPECKPPKPIRIKTATKKSKPKPVATTSDILYLLDSLKLPIPLDIYTSLIKECTELGDPLKAIELHEHIRRSRIHLSLPLINRLLLMCASCGCFEHARQLFDEMSMRDFNSWAVVIGGSVENGAYNEAIKLFIRMLHDKDLENVGENQMGFSVPGIIICVLRACIYIEDFEFGRQVHAWLWKMGYSKNTALSSFLISFYGKLKYSEGAQSVFEQVCCPNTAVWTSWIVTCCNDNNFVDVINVFKEMGREGVRKNGYTFSSTIKACGKMGDVDCGRQIHANVMKLGLESDGFVQCSLVDFYGKCGILSDATKTFEIGRNKRNGACWNAMLTNYMQHGLYIEAIKVFYEMKIAGFKPCESVFNEAMSVCGNRVSEDNMDELKLM